MARKMRVAAKGGGAMRRKVRFAVGLLLVAALGCMRVPPKNVALDRFDYGESIADSWKRETLSNIVRLRYGDAPTFMEVTSIINSYSVAGSVNAGAGFPQTTAMGGNNVAVGGSQSWSNNPTVTYQPLTGQKFTSSLLRPMPPSAVFQMVSAGWPVRLIFSTALGSINGLSNATMGRRGDPDFDRLLDALSQIQSSKALSMNVKDQKDGAAVVIVMRRESVPEDVQAAQRTVRALLGLKEDGKEYSVVFGSVPKDNLEIAVETRSMLELMLELASGVDVPPSDLAEGRAIPGRSLPGEAPPEPLIRVRYGKTAPADAFVAVPYRHMWFWIDDTDRASKTKFTFLMILFSLAQAGQPSAAPLVTVSTGK
jgi:hypothetical protein